MPPKSLSQASIPAFLLNSFVCLIRVFVTHISSIFGVCKKRELASIPEDHPFVPRGQDDSRSPCPALNTLANHGYLPRSGRNIRPRVLIKALQEGYNLTYPLAAFLTYGGFILLGQFAEVSLQDFCRHGRVEHNASLIHEDTKPGDEYAPNVTQPQYMKALEADSADGEHLTAFDVAKARVRREAESKDMDALHAEVARGEMALVLGIFGGAEEKVPLQTVRHWMMTESFPPDWKPQQRQTFFKTVRTSARIRAFMEDIREKGL